MTANVSIDLRQSIERFERFVAADPGNVLLLLNPGDLYHKASRYDDAISCYERCLSAAPVHAAAKTRIDEARQAIRSAN